jgi:hypothetical protein
VSNYYGKTYAADEKRKARRILGLPIPFAAALAVIVLGGGVALAAMLISSNTVTAAQAAGEAKPIVLSEPKFSGPLFPGGSIDLTAKAKNENDFPVTITKVNLGGNPTVNCPGNEESMVTGPLGTATTITLAADDQVTVAPGETKTVTVTKAVKLAAAATGSCSLSIPFNVTGSGAGSGN